MEVVDQVSEKRCPDGTSFVGRGEPTSPGMGERDVSFPQGVQGLSASRVRHVRLSQMSGMAIYSDVFLFLLRSAIVNN